MLMGFSIREICRRVHLSRNTVRKILRTDTTKFTYQRQNNPQPVSGSIKETIESLDTNLEFAEWDTIFHNHKMTVALLDRLTHHAQIIETGIENYRLKSKQKGDENEKK